MMKKRLLALLMAAVMTISLLPTTAWAHDAAHAEGIRDTEGVENVKGSEGDRDLEEVSDSENVPGEDAVDAAALAAVEDDGPAALAAATTLDSYFEGLPVIAETEPGSPSSTKKWKVTTLGGDTVLMSGNKGKSSSTSTLQLTFTGDTHLTFEYKVSSEKNCDKCTITLGSDKLVNGESGDQNWKPLELDAKSGQVLTVVYKKDSGVDRFDDCVYLRNFSAGEALVVTFHANNGTEDTAQQKVYGGKADDIDGWYDAQQYRCFRSSNSAIVAHETLLLTRPQYNTKITIDSVLSYTEYAKYWEKFRSDPAYAQFARFYKQPISVSVKVIGTEGIDDPNIQPITVTVNVEGGGFSRTFADLTGGTYTCSSSDGRTAADALLSVLAQNRYTYTGTPGYITGVTDANGVALTAGDKTFGPWSGWMFTVNGEMPILRTDASGNITYAALNQYQVKKDDVIRFYYVACPTETGYHTGGTATCTSGAVCTVCGAAYGEKNPNNHTGEQTWTRTADKHRMRYDCCNAEVIPSQTHSWENGACSVCGYACRHSGGEATCTTPLTCARCGEVYGAKDPANHSGELVWVTTADKHVRQYDCCGLAVTAEAAHSWENGACGVCGYACRHVGGETVKENVKPATCTADGSHDDVVYCTVCKAEMSRSTVTDKAAGHQWDKGVVTTVPTSEKEGVRTYTCTVCRAVRTEAIDKLPGSGDGKTDQAAADAVIEKINGIGTVTKNSKSAIEAARRAYDALSEDQKALIPAGAVKTLTDAEAAYAKMTRHNHSGNASGGTKDDTGKVESSRTGDAGVAMYAAMSLLSAMGGAWVVGRKRKER